jgi:tetratricopeptide (TPR) repeat protein
MVIDERRDHSFRIPRPDLSVALGTTNACNNCHTKPNETPQWAADAVKTWYGEKKNVPAHWGPAFKAGREATPEGEKLLLDLISQKATPAIVRATAIDLLGNYRSAASVTARREALHNAEPIVRLAAVRSLPEDNPEALTADLASVLRDPTRAVRVAAASRLAHIPQKRLTDSQHQAFVEAMKEFRGAEHLQLDHAGGHLALASLDREQQRIPEAIEHLTAAIKLEPYLAGPRAELASLLQEQKGSPAEIRKLRSEEADLWERDSKLAPENAEIFYRLGLLRYTLDEYDKAAAALEEACKKAPQNATYLMALALLQEKQYELSGDFEQFKTAARTLKAMHDLNPDDPRAKQILQRLVQTRELKDSGTPKLPVQPPPKPQ